MVHSCSIKPSCGVRPKTSCDVRPKTSCSVRPKTSCSVRPACKPKPSCGYNSVSPAVNVPLFPGTDPDDGAFDNPECDSGVPDGSDISVRTSEPPQQATPRPFTPYTERDQQSRNMDLTICCPLGQFDCGGNGLGAVLDHYFVCEAIAKKWVHYYAVDGGSLMRRRPGHYNLKWPDLLNALQAFNKVGLNSGWQIHVDDLKAIFVSGSKHGARPTVRQLRNSYLHNLDQAAAAAMMGGAVIMVPLMQRFLDLRFNSPDVPQEVSGYSGVIPNRPGQEPDVSGYSGIIARPEDTYEMSTGIMTRPEDTYA